MNFIRKTISILMALASCMALMAQQQNEQSDSLVRLLKSQYVQMVDVEGGRYRKVVGPARFLHNDTYLLCDTAYWNVETNIIDAWGNVSILQDETVLTSDKLVYLVDQDLAQFRGSVVQLTDKDHNTLRTRHLDYNTKDSVAVFMDGGAMRDKDGQIIESRNGTYDSKISTFTFESDVNMFTDSIFVLTRNLVYESDLDLATFGRGTNAWKDDNMLSSEAGWYDKGRELFFFTDNVHVMSADQEGWCDSLYFDRISSGVELIGNAQITDTTRNVFALAGRIEYVDSVSKVTLTRKPAVITQTETEDGGVDTVYLGAEKLVYFTLKMCDIQPSVIQDAEKRLNDLNVDPVGTFRKKAAEEAAKAAEEAAKQDPNYRPKTGAPKASAAPYIGPGRPLAEKPDSLLSMSNTAGLDSLRTALADSLAQKQTAGADTLRQIPPMRPRSVDENFQQKDSLPVASDTDSLSITDSLSVTDSLPVSDSLSVADSTAVIDSTALVPPDTTKVGFLEALGNVKIYRKDMQVVCDSLVYSDLDSLARLFIEPIIYQDPLRQYRADSISVVVNDGALEKASLMANAFITIQEDTAHYNQIKGTEMMAYFDAKGGLERFDVLGGASALFFLEENGSLATVNKTDSKMLSAVFKNGEIQRIYYFEQAKNDGYPVVQIQKDEQQLKGFSWEPDRRPADRFAVTPLSLRPSQRESYSARPHAQFTQTNIYFPGYISDIYRQIEVRDSLRIVRERERALAEQQAAARARLDSLALADSLVNVARLDSLARVDSLAAASLALADSLAVTDSLKVADSLAVGKVLTPEEMKEADKAAAKAAKEKQKAELKAAREAKKKAKMEALEAKWAEKDKRDEEKAAAKAAKKLEKERKKKRKALADQARQDERDAALLEKYRKKYEKRKLLEEAKAAGKKLNAEEKASLLSRESYQLPQNL